MKKISENFQLSKKERLKSPLTPSKKGRLNTLPNSNQANIFLSLSSKKRDKEEFKFSYEKSIDKDDKDFEDISFIKNVNSLSSSDLDLEEKNDKKSKGKKRFTEIEVLPRNKIDFNLNKFKLEKLEKNKGKKDRNFLDFRLNPIKERISNLMKKKTRKYGKNMTIIFLRYPIKNTTHILEKLQTFAVFKNIFIVILQDIPLPLSYWIVEWIW